MKAHLCLEENTNGVDWVVADIHGCHEQLMDKLNHVGFDFNKDRLICSGDLVDRGNDSLAVVKLLDEKWFYSTIGNHEMMCIDAYKHDWAVNIYAQNGGMWFFSLHQCEQDAVIMRLLGLPLTIRFSVGEKRYIVVHARIPRDDAWNRSMQTSQSFCEIPEDYIQTAVWDRHFTNPFNPTQVVEGYDIVFCGHTVLDKPGTLANYLNLDTGVVFDETKDFVIYNTKTEEIV